MKKIILSFLLLCSINYSQSWNNIVTTTINEPNLQKMDLYTNKAGNHIIVQNSNSSNSIKYYLLNSTGSVVRSSTIETAGNAEFPNVAGNNDKVYVVYKLGNNLKAKYSTNAGQSWTPIVDKAIGANYCNAVDIVYDYTGLHLVYATQDSYPDYETHYYRINSSNQWVDYKNVTDHSSLQYGGFPTVSVSENRVHVSVNTGQSEDPTSNSGIAMERDKYNSNWQTPQTVFSQGSMVEKIGNSSSKLFDFYCEFVAGMGQYHSDLYVKERSLGGTSWSSGTLIKSFSAVNPVVSISNSYDNKTHIVYVDYESVLYRNYNGSYWSSESSIETDGYYPAIYSVSNDLYVVYYSDNSGYIKYRQCDAVPLNPQNLTISAGGTYNNKPKLDWAANNEPDLKRYVIFRKLEFGNWIQLATTTNTTYTDQSVTLNLYGGVGQDAFYKIKAEDLTGNLSNFSNEVSTEIIGLNKFSIDFAEYDNIPSITKLFSNYPNPFNPETKISFQLSDKSYVSLKVYDNLGREVSVLIDDIKEAGLYSVPFNAGNLASGVYFYRLQTSNFSDLKKMILIK
ncbi:MAG: T9SS type A sorting domain-containing protein [Ignavibacteriae bacterium]|nr:T9SS type A sorting domain-containing protein [Ignavibacteriota bacterium]